MPQRQICCHTGAMHPSCEPVPLAGTKEGTKLYVAEKGRRQDGNCDDVSGHSSLVYRSTVSKVCGLFSPTCKKEKSSNCTLALCSSVYVNRTSLKLSEGKGSILPCSSRTLTQSVQTNASWEHKLLDTQNPESCPLCTGQRIARNDLVVALILYLQFIFL